jgi:LPXTG-site transpeptidase (sortase) family protein
MTKRTTAVLFVMAIAAGVFVFTLVHAVWYAPDTEVTDNAVAATHHATPVDGGSPSRITIPALNIDANVQHVGIAKSGAVAVPSNFTDVAWYRNGPEPGQAGSALIDGHVDNGLSLAGVFKHLGDAKVGDDIYIETASSTKLHFKITDIEEYPANAVPMTDLTSTTGAPRVALITCEGAWVQSARSYDHRLVVYATLVD